jgi:hypothetical protein
MARFIKASGIHTSDPIDCPEKRLFVAVLSQAIHDAFSDHVPRLEKQQAQTWLMNNSKDFKTICEVAGRDSEYVIKRIKKKILKANGWNVEITARVTSPRKRIQMRKINKNHLTGNAYYAAKAKGELHDRR